MEYFVKNIILLLIGVYVVSCGGGSIINKYPSDNFAAQAQFQIADIYLNDVKDFDFAVKEFQTVVDLYPNHEVSKKS